MSDTSFIAGCGHTGTTLLARILGSHPNIFCPPRETNIFLAYNALHHRSLLNAELESAYKQKSKAHMFIEKTPRHIWHIDFIRNFVEGSSFILCTRNGYDVIASLYKRTKDVSSSILRYKDDSLLTIRQLENSDVLLTRYEDIVYNTDEELKRICAFLEVEYKSQMLEYYKQPMMWNNETDIVHGDGAEGDGHNSLRNWQVNQPIFQGGKHWKEIIPEGSWHTVEDFFQDSGNEIMLRLGYQI